MSSACTQEIFLRDVRSSYADIVHWNGLHRHVAFRNNIYPNKRFDMITWPGHLCLDNLSETFVFSSQLDMLEYFRATPQRREYAAARGESLWAAPEVWMSRMVGTSMSGHAVFSQAKFVQNTRDFIRIRSHLNEVTRTALLQRLEREVFTREFETEAGALRSVIECGKTLGVDLEDIHFVVDCAEVSYSYLWCCYAIAWGIERIDEIMAKEKQVEAAA